MASALALMLILTVATAIVAVARLTKASGIRMT